MTAKSALGLLYTPERLKGQAAPDGFEGMREAIEAVVWTLPGKAPVEGGPSPARTMGPIFQDRGEARRRSMVMAKIDRMDRTWDGLAWLVHPHRPPSSPRPSRSAMAA